MSTHFRCIERTWVNATERKPRGLYRLPLHDGFQQAETTAQYEPRSIQADRPACTLSRNSQPRLTVFVTTAISRGMGGGVAYELAKGMSSLYRSTYFQPSRISGLQHGVQRVDNRLNNVCLHLSFWKSGFGGLGIACCF